jgi:arylsulfatase A-like enzyme
MPVLLDHRRLAPLLLLGLSACGTGAGEPPPNLVLVLADDLGWADVGYQGSTFHRTPRLDALARRGLVFSDAYAPSPVCSPSRAALLTGRSPARLKLTRALSNAVPEHPPGPATSGPADRPLWEPHTTDRVPHGVPGLGSVLRRAGYATALIGKWHLGGHPREHGFDVVMGAARWGVADSYHGAYGLPDLPDGPPEEYLTDRLTDEAIRFVEANRERPFFLFLSHFAPHSPFEAKPELEAAHAARAERLAPEAGQRNPTYAAMIESLDEGVGRLVDALERLGLAQRTVLVFTSDNGGFEERRASAATGPAYRITSNAPLRSGKGRLYEGGVRVPLIVVGPDVSTGTTDVPVVAMDLLPTFAGLAQAGLAPGELDGVDLAPVLGGGTLAREALHFHFPHQSFASSVRRGRHKLLHFWIRDRDELYDLAADPGEATDLAPTQPELAAELRAELDAWLAEVGADLPTRNPDYRR